MCGIEGPTETKALRLAWWGAEGCALRGQGPAGLLGRGGRGSCSLPCFLHPGLPSPAPTRGCDGGSCPVLVSVPPCPLAPGHPSGIYIGER